MVSLGGRGNKLLADDDAHGAGCTSDHAHSCLEASCVQITHLELSDLLNIFLRDCSDLCLVGNAGTALDVAFLLDEDGQALPTRSISAGLDYMGIGPQLAALGASGRVEFTSILDKEALEAISFFAKNEGILFAMESAHAGAAAMKIARELPKNKAVIINMSGRGDKDLFITSPVFRRDEWISFLKAEVERLESDKEIHSSKIMGE